MEKLWQKNWLIYLITQKQTSTMRCQETESLTNYNLLTVILTNLKYIFNTICHDIEDEKQWTGRNVSRAQKTWFITFITPCGALCLQYLIKSMGNWITIIMLKVDIGDDEDGLKRSLGYSALNSSPPLLPAPACTSAIINPLISCNKAGDN